MLAPQQFADPMGGAGIGARRPATTNAITPRFLLHVVRRWWRLSFMLGLLIAAPVALIIYFSYKPTYEAKTWLRVDPIYILSPNERMRQGNFLYSQREVIRSAPIISEALAMPEIASLPIFKDVEDRVSWLSSRIAASPIGASDLLTISLRGHEKDSLAKVVNAVRNAYLNTLNTNTMRQSDSTLQLLDNERTKRFQEIESLRGRLKTLQKNSIDGAEWNQQFQAVVDEEKKGNTQKQVAILSILGSLQQSLANLEIELVVKGAELQTTKDLIAKKQIQVQAGAVQEAVELHPDVIAILAEQRQLAELIRREEKFRPKEKLKVHHDKIAELDIKLATVRKELFPKVREQLVNEAKAQRGEQIEQWTSELENKRLTADALRKQIDEAKKSAKEAGANSLEMQFLAEDLNRKTGVYNRIVDRIEQMRTEMSAPTQVLTLQEAQTPIAAVDSGPIAKSLTFAGAVFFLPLGLFFVWEWMTRRVADIDDFSGASNLRVVGEIATLPVRSKLLPGGSRKFEESLSRFEESIDYLRTAVLIARHQTNVKSLVICSSTSREGKSTVAAHLASSLARGVAGRVLLIDADMRRPHLHRLLDEDLEPGLVDFLAGRAELGDIVRSTWVERLDFVSAGALDSPVGSLLAGDKLEAFLRHAESEYEFILIDVPPILPVSDGLIIARCANAAIFCGLRDVSTFTNITRACEKLKSAGVNVIGAVFNGVPASHYGSSYYYYRIPRGTAKGSETTST